VPVEATRERYKISEHFLYCCVDGTVTGMEPLPPLPRRRVASTGARRARRLRGDRKSVIRRVWRTAEAQVRDIEARLSCPSGKPEERERDGRLLSVLVKTLRELSGIDATGRATSKQTETAAEDDAVPRDIEEFRRELARKMDAIVAGRADRASGGSATG
jgi:hypothetical protein